IATIAYVPFGVPVAAVQARYHETVRRFPAAGGFYIFPSAHRATDTGCQYHAEEYYAVLYLQRWECTRVEPCFGCQSAGASGVCVPLVQTCSSVRGCLAGGAVAVLR